MTGSVGGSVPQCIRQPTIFPEQLQPLQAVQVMFIPGRVKAARPGFLANWQHLAGFSLIHAGLESESADSQGPGAT